MHSYIYIHTVNDKGYSREKFCDLLDFIIVLGNLLQFAFNKSKYELFAYDIIIIIMYSIGTQNGTYKLVWKFFMVCRKSVKTMKIFPP